MRTLHSCYEDKYNQNGNMIKNKLIMYYINKALQVSDLIICVSQAVKKTYLDRFNLSHKNITIVYNGIDKKFFEKTKKRQNHITDKIIYIGRLEEVKGVNLLIDAFSILQSKYSIKLCIVGDGAQRNNLERQARDLGIDENIEFLGTRKDVVSLLDNADIFVYPSIWEEAFGISVVEAMSRGCIPVTFRKGGLPEIISNGKDGFLVDEISSQNLCQMIENVINEKDRESLIERAKDKAKEFDIENTIKKLKEEYEKISSI